MCVSEIYRESTAVYGRVVDELKVHCWCQQFNAGRANFHDEETCGRPSVR